MPKKSLTRPREGSRNPAAVPSTLNPHEAERAVIGAILLRPDLLDGLDRPLDASDFYASVHRKVWQAILDLRDAGEPGGTVTVCERLRPTVSSADVSSLVSDAIPDRESVRYHVEKIRAAANERDTLAAVTQGACDIHNGTRSGGEVRDAIIALESAADGWVDPLPLDRLDSLPGFPLETLPDWLHAWVAAEAVATQTPPALAGKAALGVVAAACRGLANIELAPGHVEPLNLYAVVALPPGTRKSAVLRHATAPVEEFEREQAKRLRHQVRTAQDHLEILEARLSNKKKDSAKGRHVDYGEIAELSAKVEKARQDLPREPRLVAGGDITPEEIVSLLVEQGGRLAIFSTEGELFEVLAGRYAKNGVSNIEAVLKAHSGDPIRVDRVGRPPQHVPNPCLTICLTVQPEVLRELADKPRFRGRGLLGRFLYTLPANPLGRRRVDPPPVPDAILAAYTARIRGLLDIPLPRTPHTLTLAVEARPACRDFAEEVERMLHPTGELGHMTDWGGKLLGTVGRIAGLIHLAHHMDASWAIPVSTDTIAGAIRLGRYLIEHAKAAFETMGTDLRTEEARYLWDRIQATGETFLEYRLLWRAVHGKFPRAAPFQAALALLESLHYIRLVKQPSTGGRPKHPAIRVNPLARRQ